MKKLFRTIRKWFRRSPKQTQIVTNSTVGGTVTQIQGGRDVYL